MNNHSTITLLIIEDDPEDARLVKEYLKDHPKVSYRLENATTLKEGLRMIEERRYDVVLLDLYLPDSTRTSAVDTLIEKAPDLPLIVLSGADDENLAIKAVQKGAQDYLLKGETPKGVLTRAIHYAMERKQTELKLNQTVTALKEANNKILEQQKAIVQEERLKVLLQLTGATAHELNQPLMVLLGNIEMLQLDQEKSLPKNKKTELAAIKEAGEKIAGIVKKIQTLRDKTLPPEEEPLNNSYTRQAIQILCVDDIDWDYERLKNYLKSYPHVHLNRSKTIKEAFSTLETQKTDLILLDHMLPDGTSITFMDRLEKEKIDLPVIIITGQGDEMIASETIQKGAFGYISKNSITRSLLLQTINQAIEKYRLKKEERLAIKKMVKMSTMDELTGLYNRRYGMEALKRELDRAKRYRTDLVLCVTDLDHFKTINDSFGHAMGDRILSEFSQKLKEVFRLTDLICRYGGEEFLIIMPHANLQNAKTAAERLKITIMNHPFEFEEERIPLTVSTGIAEFDLRYHRNEFELFKAADQALYAAKEGGRNQVITSENPEGCA